MEGVSDALNEIKGLYKKVIGEPAPEIGPGSYVSFPFGADPLSHAILEAKQIQQFSEQVKSSPKAPAWVPPADCYATPDAYIIHVEVAGVPRQDVNVLAGRGECIVRGERKPVETGPGFQPMVPERPWGPFERTFPLPPGSRTEQMKASYLNGVLELRIPIQSKGLSDRKKVKVD